MAVAAWDNKPEIVNILIDNGGLGENGAAYGALHGAITHRMFKAVERLINEGCDVNESYINVTPLGTSLTCGKNKSGDARLVKRLLNAKADILGITKLCWSPYYKGKMTEVVNVARTYSNSRCVELIEVAYYSALKQQLKI